MSNTLFSCISLLKFHNRITVKKFTSKNNRLHTLPPIKPNKLLFFIKKLLKIIFSKKSIYSSLIIFITGFLGRYLILIYLQVNVFTDIFNPISISFYGLISAHALVVRELFSHI